MRWVVAVAAMVAGGCSAAAGNARAVFLTSGTYATEEGCAKLKALAKGGPRNVGTVPETLTTQGFKSWEGGCAFASIHEKKRHKLYVARMTCFEGADRWTEKNEFELDLTAGAVKVTTLDKDRKTTVYKKCDTGK